MAKAAATISDVARRARVSTSTVSHVINGTRLVSPEKTALVNEAYLRLVCSAEPGDWNGCGHFSGAASWSKRRGARAG